MKFDIRRSKIGGKGCFATKDINKEEVIKRLSGEVVSRTEINKRILKGIERIDDPLQIGDDLFIDLDEPSYFFNHSCNPNAGIRRKSELFAIKGISKGEEITFDYSTTVGKDIDWIMNLSWDTEVKKDRDGERKLFVYLDCMCEYVSGKLQPAKGIERLEWVNIKELSKYDHVPPSRKLLKKLGYL